MFKKRAGIIIGIPVYAVLFSFVFSPLTISAEDRTVNGYTLSMVSVSQSGDTLEVSGRLEHGPTCKHLKLSVLLQSDKGNHKTINCMVKDAGTGSSLFEGTTKVKKNEPQTWSVEDVNTKCMGS